MAGEPRPRLDAIWKSLSEEDLETSAEQQTEDLAKLIRRFGMGGRAWKKQLIGGFPIAGCLAEFGVYPTQPTGTPSINCKWPFKVGQRRFLASKGESSVRDGPLWEEANGQTAGG